MNSFSTALGAGLALGGVLALCGSWSRGGGTGGIPHLAVGLAPALGVAAAIRLAPHGRVAAIAAASVLGGAFGYGAQVLQANGPAARRLPLGLDLAVAAVGLGVAALLAGRPFATGSSALGGSWPEHAGATAVVPNGAGVAFVALVAAVALARLAPAALPAPARWAIAGALAATLGLQAAWGWGVTAPTVPPEPLTLALAAFAAGALGRSPLTAAAVGMGLGLACASLELLGVPSAVPAAALALAALPSFSANAAPEAA